MKLNLLIVALLGCSHPQAQSVSEAESIPPPAERRVVHDGQPPFCTISSSASDGACGNNIAECQRLRSHGDSECEPWSAAACFVARVRVSGDVVRFCTPSIAQCDRFIATHTADLEVDDDRCFLFRQ